MNPELEETGALLPRCWLVPVLRGPRKIYDVGPQGLQPPLEEFRVERTERNGAELGTVRLPDLISEINSHCLINATAILVYARML